MSVPDVRLGFATLVADDIGALCAFYATLLGLGEAPGANDIYRALDLGNGVTLSFSAPVVYDLLGMGGYTPASGTRQFLTFEVGSEERVTELASSAVELGATVLHEPYDTYYGAYQAVLADPEGNAFRLNHTR